MMFKMLHFMSLAEMFQQVIEFLYHITFYHNAILIS